MRSLIRLILYRPIQWIINRFTSAPDRDRVFASLSALLEAIRMSPGKKGFALPFDSLQHKFIIFSDHHKGRKNGADDFMPAEANYLAALEHYERHKFHLIALGDSEELWENTILQVRKHNAASFDAERRFAARGAFTKIFGNHDLDWDIDPLAPTFLRELYGMPLPVFEGIVLQTTVVGEVLSILCTHGHQGDMQSDGNWFSKFFVAKVWAPLQAFLKIYPNTPAYDTALKTKHNSMMYEWSAFQNQLLLITGHTHQPVFESLTHVERLNRQRKQALYENNRAWAEALDDEIRWRSIEHQSLSPDYMTMKPTYFNAGCCCFPDGDITGIEIAEGYIRLIKWEKDGADSKRIVLEESSLEKIAERVRMRTPVKGVPEGTIPPGTDKV